MFREQMLHVNGKHREKLKKKKNECSLTLIL